MGVAFTLTESLSGSSGGSLSEISWEQPDISKALIKRVAAYFKGRFL